MTKRAREVMLEETESEVFFLKIPSFLPEGRIFLSLFLLLLDQINQTLDYNKVLDLPEG